MTSDTELMDRIYIVTPTTTGSPEKDNKYLKREHHFLQESSFKKRLQLYFGYSVS